MVNNFFDNKLHEEFVKKGKLSPWKMMGLIVLKYELPVKTQGLGAINIAQEILRLHKEKVIHPKFTKREIEFIKEVAEGEWL